MYAVKVVVHGFLQYNITDAEKGGQSSPPGVDGESRCRTATLWLLLGAELPIRNIPKT